MQTLVLAIFLVLHGLVHLLYTGQSKRSFELRPGMSWPDGSWFFSRFLGNKMTRLLATVSLALAALGFVTAGIGLLLHQDWWQPTVLGAATFSGTIFLLFWDGKLRALDDQGGIGLLIDLTILAVLLFYKGQSGA